MSTLDERQRFADLIEKGKNAKVGYYYSACVIFGDIQSGEIAADPLGLALIGNWGDPAKALELFQTKERMLPESNPGCIRSACVLGELVGTSPSLVLDIWTGCGSYHDSATKKEEAVKDFLHLLRREEELPVSHLRPQMQDYLQKAW
jgi:hypothetical protein